MSHKAIVRVRDVMRAKFDMVEGLDTVADALKKSQHPESKCFVVDMRHDDDEYGIVLLSDIAKSVLAKDKSPERVNIYEIMSKPVISINPEMDIRYCSRLFENFGINRAPVIEDNKVIGVVGYSNIVLRGVRDRLS
ncbi:MAG: CBS domain-containing protein [Gammaproteobacteria bacterium]|nr:CBS domain-containing protein [Gammaproteobacteria bacterium]